MQKGRKAMQGVSFCRADTGFDCLHPDCVCVIKIKAAPRYQFQRFAPSCTGLPRSPLSNVTTTAGAPLSRH